VGALQTKVENGTITHYFTNGLCIDCRTCQLFCPRQAISRDREQVENPFDTAKISSKNVNACQVCGKPTDGMSKHLCYMCEQNATNQHQLVIACKEIFLSI
jgi:Fe-S-cluster-containing hydrogenase component 2